MNLDKQNQNVFQTVVGIIIRSRIVLAAVGQTSDQSSFTCSEAHHQLQNNYCELKKKCFLQDSTEFVSFWCQICSYKR
ncbi:CLUMA_CG013608, isoform A [Clunio marinus]|uniref:CLUMA_CG013608, isoform A n=1 Tax=Clunio marinus TaxID=568069 RepID=A0A1J1IJB2_9DIPT|nr:CLUMA_CG013608, isoform A [Clunio marinus]